jgi:hypothetical protein
MTVATKGKAPAKAKAKPAKVAPATGTTPTVTILATLDQALSKVRTLNPDVPTAVAITLASGKGKTHGHVSPSRWVDTDGEHKGSARHELNMATESFSRGAEETLVTLIHEAAHLAAIARDIQDTSRQGRYHNKAFRDIAESFGLTTDTNDKFGYVTTGLQSWAAEAYKVELEALTVALSTHRVLEAKKPTKKTTVKVSCECVNDNGNLASVTVPISWFDNVGHSLVCQTCSAPLSEV